MKILSIGNFTRGWDGSICDEEHIAGALEELGHTVERWQREDTPFGSTPQGRFDFVLISQWNGYPPNLITTLREIMDVPVVYWAFDYQWDKNDGGRPEEWHVRLVEESSLFLTKELSNIVRYQQIMEGGRGGIVRWLPQDFAPKFLDKLPEPIPAEYDVLFTGSHLPWSPERTEFLKIVDERFNLHVFSVTPDQWKNEGLKNVHGPIMDEGLPELYGKAKVNLSFDWKKAPGYWSDRNAQIMACGGFVLFRHVAFSEMVFRDNIEYFYDNEDAIQKIDFFLKHDHQRIYRAKKGYEFAHNNLFVINRVKDLLTIVESIL